MIAQLVLVVGGCAILAAWGVGIVGSFTQLARQEFLPWRTWLLAWLRGWALVLALMMLLGAIK